MLRVEEDSGGYDCAEKIGGKLHGSTFNRQDAFVMGKKVQSRLFICKLYKTRECICHKGTKRGRTRNYRRIQKEGGQTTIKE